MLGGVKISLIPSDQVQMEARPRASTSFVLDTDRLSKPARLDRADTLQLDEDIVIRQAQSTQRTQPTQPTRDTE